MVGDDAIPVRKARKTVRLSLKRPSFATPGGAVIIISFETNAVARDYDNGHNQYGKARRSE